MIKIINKTSCCGCSTCKYICPKGCIELEQDKEGFYYPIVDESLCIGCNICKDKCPILNDNNITNDIRKTFGAINIDKKTRQESSSGGVFSLLASNVINEGGVVFGASLSKDCYKVNHIKVTEMTDLYKLRTSKYVQSNINDAYKETKECLNSGMKVMFTGTPCQIAGLKSYLGKDYSNLLTQDMVCHGTPSPKVWESYIKYMEIKYKSKAKSVNFRYKAPGLRTYSMRIEFENGKVYCKENNIDLFLRGYLTNLFLKPACYSCHFKGLDRLSDITLADFWGVSDYAPGLDKEFGVSLVTIHTQNGIDIFNEIKNSIECIEVGDEPVIANSCSVKSTSMPMEREKFWYDFDVCGDAVFSRYFGLNIYEKLKRIFKKCIRKY